jgi:hypothetical protein
LSGTICAILWAGTAPADPQSMPAMSGSLNANANPISLDAGPLGDVSVSGALTGVAFWQSNFVRGDHQAVDDLSNAQLFLQGTRGWLQFFVQGGTYSLPSLGSSYLGSDRAPDNLYGFVPQAFVRIAPAENVSIQIGKLPTLIGDEYTFTFENTNIERGLLWNQEPAVSRGIQFNYTDGPVSAAVSWNDGFYSDRFNWLSASLAYTVSAHDTLTLIGGGNFGRTAHADAATPLFQNNGQIYDLILAHTSGSWAISPYIQYTLVPPDAALGISHGASTYGAAILASYEISDKWKLGGRLEYIQAAGSRGSGAPNLLYGPRSRAWSLTVTPTYQFGIFFARADAAYVGIGGATPGAGFGPNLDKSAQVRFVLEAGVLF